MNIDGKNLKHIIICAAVDIAIIIATMMMFVNDHTALSFLTRPIYLILGALIAAMFTGVYIATVWYYRRTNRNLLHDVTSSQVPGNMIDLLLSARKMPQKDYKKYQVKQSDITYMPKEQAHGIIFGIQPNNQLFISPEDEPYHTMVIGGTRSGKTSAILIPTLRAWQHTAFVVDISGDISKNVQRVDKIELNLTEPKEQVYYNIYHYVDAARTRTELWGQMEILATALMPPEAAKGGEADQYFREEGRRLFLATMVYLHDQGMDFCESCQEFVSTAAETLIDDILADTNADPRILATIRSFSGTNMKNVKGCKQNADSCVEKFAYDENIISNLHRGKSAIVPEMLESKSLYIIIPQHLLTVYAPVLSIISQQIMYYFKIRSVTPQTKTCLMCLDEFPQLGMIPDINNCLMTLAKKKVRLMLFVQSDASLNRIYGSDTRVEMLTNCGYKCILNATDPETQETYSRLIGEHHVEHRSVSVGDSTSYNYSLQQERIVEPAAFAYLKDHLYLLTPFGYMKLTKKYYFKDISRYIPDEEINDSGRFAR